jgi:hypothetical protein
MRHDIWRPLVVFVVTLALAAVSPSTLHAQDRPDEHRDDNTAEHHDDRGAPHHDQHAPARPDERHNDDRHNDPADQYRHDHPGSAARCHDGFFTKTTDRNRACSKHGGIDVWLVL